MAFTTKSIIDMFSVQIEKNQPQNVYILSISLSTILSLKNIEKKIRETWFKSQIQAIHNLSEILYLKTIEIDKYRYILNHKLNLYQKQ